MEVTVKFVENPDYYIKLDQAKQTYNADAVRQEIAMYYGSEEEFFSQYGSYYSSVDDVVQQGIDNEMQGVYQYLPEEMVVSAVYSKAELMKQAGMNTLLGMGTVFVVLIFISFIISLFKFLPALFAKKPKIEDLKKEESKPAKTSKGRYTGTSRRQSDERCRACSRYHSRYLSLLRDRQAMVQ